jgi:hypothetical protein
MRLVYISVAALALLGLPTTSVDATDVDGPDGPGQHLIDRADSGDAPHCIPAYSSGQIGHFPSLACPACGDVGTQELDPGCEALSTAPGPTGQVWNLVLYDAWWAWLGCHVIEPLYTIEGIDSDTCGAVTWPHCVEEAFGMTFEQDECPDDPTDAGVTTLPVLSAKGVGTVDFTFTAFDLPVYLNILVDFNEDGDWNDSFSYDDGGSTVCAPEWAVKNHLLGQDEAVPGSDLYCFSATSPEFQVGPNPGESWFRITLSYFPVDDDFPWRGGQVGGGETEDYPVTIGGPLPAHVVSWGRIKARYP